LAPFQLAIAIGAARSDTAFADMQLSNTRPSRILLLGASGTIGRAVLAELVQRRYEVLCLVRQSTEIAARFPDVMFRECDLTDARSIANDGFRGETFEVVVSCMASRSGTAADAWAIDHGAHRDVLAAAKSAGIGHFILLSAICVQKPRLAFQHAKLAFEQALIESGLTYSIVRPTAFFKSLSGQVERVKKGKSFLLFGDGNLTACKPISDFDLASFLCDCIHAPGLHNRILPIGGPGDAMTPKQQGEMLFDLLKQEPRFRHVPVGLLDIIVGVLNMAGQVIPAAARKAELARIGRYYATESMLVLNPETGLYDAAVTPSTGTETLRDHYRQMINGETTVERREHAVF
jgi:divinyl chlorophyllide a 8-vinyl-reductase